MLLLALSGARSISEPRPNRSDVGLMARQRPISSVKAPFLLFQIWAIGRVLRPTELLAGFVGDNSRVHKAEALAL